MPRLPTSNPKGLRAFERTIGLSVATDEGRPVSPPGGTRGEFRIGELHSITIAFKLATLSAVDIQLYGALRNEGDWFKINNGEFTGVAEFCESISCAGLTHLYVSFSNGVGAGEEELVITANGVRRSEA